MAFSDTTEQQRDALRDRADKPLHLNSREDRTPPTGEMQETTKMMVGLYITIPSLKRNTRDAHCVKRTLEGNSCLVIDQSSYETYHMIACNIEYCLRTCEESTNMFLQREERKGKKGCPRVE